jgi:hypothetical protein
MIPERGLNPRGFHEGGARSMGDRDERSERKALAKTPHPVFDGAAFSRIGSRACI